MQKGFCEGLKKKKKPFTQISAIILNALYFSANYEIHGKY